MKNYTIVSHKWSGKKYIKKIYNLNAGKYKCMCAGLHWHLQRIIQDVVSS